MRADGATVRVLAPGARRADLAEILEHRELLGFLVWRDIVVRYKQTLIGVAWALAQPVATAVIFTIFLGRFASMPTDGIAAPVFYLAGLVPWTYFAAAVSRASSSLVEHQRLVTRVYFPRVLLPLAGVLAPTLDAALSLGALFVLLAVTGTPISLRLFALLPLTVGLIGFAFALGLFLAGLNARYRDVRHAIPFGLQLLMFASPVAYPTSIVPASMRLWYALNPLSPLIEGFRWALGGRGTFDSAGTAVASVVGCSLLFVSIRRFRVAEATIADVV